jgi:hypothetical protein
MPTSSAISRAPDLSIATQTGLPGAFVTVAKSGHDVPSHAVGLVILEGYEDDLASMKVRPIPAAVLAAPIRAPPG